MVEMTGPYRVIVERWGKWWTVEVPDVPGGHSQARRLDQVEATARELIAFQLELPDSKISEIELTLEIRLPADLAAEVDAARREAEAAKREAEAARKRERAALERAARRLTGASLTQREAAKVLGLSHQRVHQVLTGR
jgi:hypothetical protein